MKKLILLMVAAAATIFGARAQILWQVSGGNAQGTSYLFGTHHLAPVSVTDSVKGFNEALDAATLIVGEVETAGMTDPAVMQGLMGHYMAPADSTLTAVLTPAQIDSVNSVLAKYTGGMASVEQMAAMKPAVIATQLALFMAMEAMPEAAQAIATGEPLDAHIQKRAAAAGKELRGFETLDRQMTLLMDTPIAEQAVDLMKSVTMSMDGSGAAMSRALTDAYLSQNLDEIETLVFDPKEMTPEAKERLISARNRDWVRQLTEILPANRVLVAVGVGHLPGEEGLIALLRSAGYTVEPVK